MKHYECTKRFPTWMGYFFDSYFNLKNDDLHFDTCLAPIGYTLNDINRNKFERLALSTCDHIPEGVYFRQDNANHDVHMADVNSLELYGDHYFIGHKTLGSFLHSVKRPYLPNLRYLIDWHSEPIFIEATQVQLRGLMRPIFFRYKEEGAGGLQIVPLLESEGYLRGFEILWIVLSPQYSLIKALLTTSRSIRIPSWFRCPSRIYRRTA